MSDDNVFQNLALALASYDGPDKGIGNAVDIMQRAAPANIPDVGRAREALAAWGIPFEAGGPPIGQMFGSTPTLKVELPDDWIIDDQGGGHKALMDAAGAERIRWHIHGWDLVALDVCRRFYTRVVNVSATSGVYQVLDGSVVIHVVPITYPHARLRDGAYFYNGDDWTEEMRHANYEAREAAATVARDWLAANRPGYASTTIIQSWLL